jgi:hypothetical protein
MKLPAVWLKNLDAIIEEILGETTSEMACALRDYWTKVYSESVYPKKPGVKEVDEISHDLACFLDGWKAREAAYSKANK